MFAHQFEFFLKLKSSHIIHFSQFVQLPKCETSFTQVGELYLTVVLRHILKGIRAFVKKFI